MHLPTQQQVAARAGLVAHHSHNSHHADCSAPPTTLWCMQAAGCQLTPLGWCCFGTLCCVALPLSWLPFVCAFCKQQYQRPVYGYPMDCLTVSFIAAAAEDAWSKQKSSVATSAPSIHCMDASMLEPMVETQDQLQQRHRQQQDASAQLLRERCTPSPPPMSIFIPPSAVPACELPMPGPQTGTASDACWDPAQSVQLPLPATMLLLRLLQLSIIAQQCTLLSVHTIALY